MTPDLLDVLAQAWRRGEGTFAYVQGAAANVAYAGYELMGKAAHDALQDVVRNE